MVFCFMILYSLNSLLRLRNNTDATTGAPTRAVTELTGRAPSKPGMRATRLHTKANEAPASKVEMMQLLHRLSRQTNKTIFLSTHDLELALQIADKIWLMDKMNGVTIGTPEDLSLSGKLSSFFARKGIVFDLETGLFRVDNEYTSQIRLVGHGQKYAMVRKALQRNGILANRTVESDTYIETGDLKDGNGFILHPQEGEAVTLNSIEELLERLQAGSAERAV